MGQKNKKSSNPESTDNAIRISNQVLLVSSAINAIAGIFGFASKGVSFFYEPTFIPTALWLVSISFLVKKKLDAQKKRQHFWIDIYFTGINIFLFSVFVFFILNPPCLSLEEPIAQGKTGILVADFTEGNNNINTREGSEFAKRTVDNVKGRVLDLPIGSENVVVRRVCAIKNLDEAKKKAKELNAKVVVWGQMAEFTDGAFKPYFYIHIANREELDNLQILQTEIVSSDLELPDQLAARVDAVVSFAIGLTYIDLARESNNPKDYEVALNEFSRAILITEENPALLSPANSSYLSIRATLAVFYVLRGEAQLGFGKPERALDDFDQAKSYNPNYMPAFIAAGNIFYVQGNYAEAKKQYAQAISIKESTSGYYGLGIASFYLGEYSGSLVALKSALGVAKEEEKNAIRLFIGEVSKKSGLEVDFAIAELWKVINSNGASEEEKEAAQTLMNVLRSTTTPLAPESTSTQMPVINTPVSPTQSNESSQPGTQANSSSAPAPVVTTTVFPVPIFPLLLPSTGFPRGIFSIIPLQPPQKQYVLNYDMILEIPKLGTKASIVGVPYVGNEWDITWLGNNVGYLDWTAFPTHTGNSVMTGHVWNADNTPGVFSNLRELSYGDQVLIKAWEEVYTFEVRENERILPSQTWVAIEHMENYSWLTLLTCEDFSENPNEYKYRRMVRVVLISAESE